ncbi:hypothetical protein LEBU106379_11055 [Lentilactobacillus buchneri]
MTFLNGKRFILTFAWVTAVGSNGAVITGPSFKKIVFTLRSQQDRSALTSFIIVDAQSVKNTATAENKGYDAVRRSRGLSAIWQLISMAFPKPFTSRGQMFLIEMGRVR